MVLDKSKIQVHDYNVIEPYANLMIRNTCHISNVIPT